MAKRKTLTEAETWAMWVLQNEKKLKEMHYKYMNDEKTFIEFNDFANFIYQEAQDLIETNEN